MREYAEMFLKSEIGKYLLHESSMKEFICDKSQINIVFDDGFWTKTHNQLEQCKIILKIDNLEKNNADHFVNIKRSIVRKRGVFSRQISIAELEIMLKKNKLFIDSEFYSDFEHAILIFGRISRYAIEIKITDIKEISFIHA